MRRLSIIFLGILLLFPVTGQARKKSKKSAVPQVRSTQYEKITSAATKANGAFMSLYIKDNKVYIELPLEYMERSILLGTTVSESSNSQIAQPGYKTSDPLHIQFVRLDSIVQVREVITKSIADKKYEASAKRCWQNPVLASTRVLGWSPDSTSVIFDLTKLLTSDNDKMRVLAENYSILKVNKTFEPNLTTLQQVRAYSDNASVSMLMTYTYTLDFASSALNKGRVTARVDRSFLLLPKEPMKYRISDSRVGVFLTDKSVLSAKNDGFRFMSVAHRWRLEPRDTAAWLRGELTEPKKPIIWYIDNTFPEDWKDPLKRSVTIWNKAFEKIGFKNVMQARDFPTKEEDPEFDPDNLKYSCIRYLPVAVQNAMGPSWVDPRSGEIINASVLVYNDVVKLINSWLFVQTSQIDPRVRQKQMPEDLMHDALTYAFSHEIGHTLGLMHNMGASSAVPVDSLRSATYTQQYGTTPSIMDYARYNYVAQPEDNGVRLSPPDMGIYDEYVIRWLYSPVAGNLSPEDERKVIEKWIDEKAGDARYRYGRQQVYSRYDPTSLEEDLGDDAIKAGEYGIKNLKYILLHLSQWITDDPDFSHRNQLYTALYGQYQRYLSNVLENVGGIKITEVKEGTPGKMYQSVDSDIQRKSLYWIVDQLRTCTWMDEPELDAHFPLGISVSVMLANKIGRALIERDNNVLLSSSYAEEYNEGEYSQKDYYDDLFLSIWESTAKGRGLTVSERFLQRAVVKASAQRVKSFIGEGNKTKSATSTLAHSRLGGLSLQEIATYNLDPTGYVNDNLDRLLEMEEKMGIGSIAAQLPCMDVCTSYSNFGEQKDYGFQQEVATDLIDDSEALNLNLLKRIYSLLQRKATSAPYADRPHYQYLLMQIRNVLEK